MPEPFGAVSATLFALAQEVVVLWNQPINPATLGTGDGMSIVINGDRFDLNAPVAEGSNGARYQVAALVGPSPDANIVRYQAPSPPFGSPVEAADGTPSPSFTRPWLVG